MPSFSVDKNKNYLTHSRKMFVVQIVKYRERKTLQTDTTHKKKHTNKPEPQNKTLLNIFRPLIVTQSLSPFI